MTPGGGGMMMGGGQPFNNNHSGAGGGLTGMFGLSSGSSTPGPGYWGGGSARGQYINHLDLLPTSEYFIYKLSYAYTKRLVYSNKNISKSIQLINLFCC